MIELLVQACRTVYEWLCPVQTVRVGVSLSVRDTIADFDWLRDYGRIWEPGSTAFWLEPDTCDQLASWQAKYRPRDFGLVVASDTVRIEWVEPIPNPYRQAEVITKRPHMSEYRNLQDYALAMGDLQQALMNSNYQGPQYNGRYGNLIGRSNIRRPHGRRA